MTKSRQKFLHIFLITLSALASLKMLIFTVGMDEEYQVVMAYRNAMGDRLFLEMWEPHQSSAFLCTLLMKPFLNLFGTTGIVMYLRICGTLIHLGISVYLYSVLKGFVSKDYSWLLALIYYNTIPKQIILPEFGIMQVWSYTLLTLFLIRFYEGGRKVRFLALAAFAMALNVLSYPSCLILFPFVLFFIGRFSGKDRWRHMGIFTFVCGLCAAGYLGMLFTYTGSAELLETLSHIVHGDVTHSFSVLDKFLLNLQKVLYEAALWAGSMLLSLAVAKWKKLGREKLFCLSIIMSCAVQLFYWVILNTGYEYMHIHLITATVAGLCVCAERQEENSDMHRRALLMQCGIMGAVLSLLAVVYLTDLSLTESIPHAMMAAIFGAVLLAFSLEKTQAKTCPKWIYAVLLTWCFTVVVGKGYTLRVGGGGYANVLQSGGIMKEGPAAGIISNYIGAYIYNCDYEDWQIYLRDGDRVLIKVDQILNLGTIQYLFKDVEISHYSIVNPTAYDERLLEYWEMYPEKAPNVIIVDCWYGQLMTDPEGWLMQYIENDFGYTRVDDGRYIRIYRAGD